MANLKTFNITASLSDLAQRRPQQVAVWNPDGRTSDGNVHFSSLTYTRLEGAVNCCARRLLQCGIRPGDRTLLLIRPDLDFILATLALLRVGAVPVFIEPAMGLKSLRRCLGDAAPSVLLAPPLLQTVSFLLPEAWKHIRKRLLPAQIFGQACSDESLADPIPVVTTSASEAVVSFTSGSTGIPKGMIYRHGMLSAQMQTVQHTFQIAEGETGMFGLSAFALLALMSGITIVLPELRHMKQSGQMEAQFFVETARLFQVQSTFASPASLQTLLAYCSDHSIHLPGMRRVILGGAPIHAAWLRALQPIFPDGDGYVSLGSTEITPLSAITASEALKEPQPGGELAGSVCVGFPCQGNKVRVIEIRDAAISQWEDGLERPHGTIGEITVQSPFAIEGYLNRPVETALAQIETADGFIYRTGDLGTFDAQGRLWFVGRKAHRVEVLQQTFFPLPCEAAFLVHPAVARCALVKIFTRAGAAAPGLVVELRPAFRPDPGLREELLALGAARPHTRAIHQIFFYPTALPTDIRHHSKILRDRLSEWAQSKQGSRL